MERRGFYYKGEDTSKFWTIHWCGQEYMVNYGKEGVLAGRFDIKEFDSEEKCLAQVEKQIASKLKKGYVEDPDFDFDNRIYIDNLEYGLHILTSHPKFSVHFTEEFYYDCCDEEAPFGSDEGSDTLDMLEDYIKKNGEVEVYNLPRKIISETWDLEYIDPGDHTEDQLNKLLGGTDEYKGEKSGLPMYQILMITDQVIIACAFGQIKIMGRIFERLRDTALKSLWRLNAVYQLIGNGESHCCTKMEEDLVSFKNEGNQPEPSDTCVKLMEYLDCPCQVFNELLDDDDMICAYEKAVLEGKKEGYTPLLVIVDDILLEKVEMEVEDELDGEGDSGISSDAVKTYREAALKRAAELDYKEVLANLAEELEEMHGEEELTVGRIGGGEELRRFSSFWNYGTKRSKEVILAKVPVTNPWELAIYMPMGGFNSCPSPESQAAVMKHWYEVYGARPGIVSYETWELALDHSVPETEDAAELALAHYQFCADRIDQYGEDYSLGKLADSLMKSTVWYFWWD